MGEKYIKIENGKEVVYEEGAFGFGEIRIGELHENMNGTKQTRNITGPNVKVENEGFLSVDRNAEIDGQKGVFASTYYKDGPVFKPDEATEEDDVEERNVSSHSSGLETKVYSGGFSHTTTKVTPESNKTSWASFYEDFGYFAELVGAHKLARWFFNSASEAYMLRGDLKNAAYMAKKGGHFEEAISYYLNINTKNFDSMADRIAIKNNLGRFLVKQYEMVSKYKNAADIAYKTGMLEEAMELYYSAGLNGDGNGWAGLDCFEDAGRIAESLGLEDRAIEIYEFGGKHVKKNYNYSDPVSILITSDDMIDKAKDLRKKKK